MPNLYKRGRYWWCWGYDYQGRRWQATTKQSDKRAAERVARRLELERALPPDGPPRLGLGEALMLLRAHKERKGSAPATMDILRTKGGHLVRVFGGETDVHALRLADAERYMDQRRAEGVSDHTIAKELGVLREALREASRHDRYHGDPRSIWPSSLTDYYTPRTTWLTAAQYRRLLLAVTRYRRDYLTIYCHTGVRYSELYAIEARDLDRAGRRVFIRGTKTKKSQRWVPMSADAEVVLLRLAQEHPTGPLFPGIWYRHRMVQDLRKWCARAGVPRVTANDLRRTFASWMFNAGVAELTCVKLMGHASSKMVREVYAQLSEETLRDAIDRLPSAVADMQQTSAALDGTTQDFLDERDNGAGNDDE